MLSFHTVLEVTAWGGSMNGLNSLALPLSLGGQAASVACEIALEIQKLCLGVGTGELRF